MADIVNLNKARKARAKAKKRRHADANAVKFGRTRAERAQDATSRDADAARLEAHRRDPCDPKNTR